MIAEDAGFGFGADRFAELDDRDQEVC